MDNKLDGKYSVYREFKGEKTKLGSFTIKDETISFPSTYDKHSIDFFEEGPMSSKAKKDLGAYINNKHNHISIQKS